MSEKDPHLDMFGNLKVDLILLILQNQRAIMNAQMDALWANPDISDDLAKELDNQLDDTGAAIKELKGEK